MVYRVVDGTLLSMPIRSCGQFFAARKQNISLGKVTQNAVTDRYTSGASRNEPGPY